MSERSSLPATGITFELDLDSLLQFALEATLEAAHGQQMMVSLVNSHTNATRIGWHLWEIDIRVSPGLPPGWLVTFPQLSVAAVFCSLDYA